MYMTSNSDKIKGMKKVVNKLRNTPAMKPSLSGIAQTNTTQLILDPQIAARITLSVPIGSNIPSFDTAQENKRCQPVPQTDKPLLYHVHAMSTN